MDGARRAKLAGAGDGPIERLTHHTPHTTRHKPEVLAANQPLSHFVRRTHSSTSRIDTFTSALLLSAASHLHRTRALLRLAMTSIALLKKVASRGTSARIAGTSLNQSLYSSRVQSYSTKPQPVSCRFSGAPRACSRAVISRNAPQADTPSRYSHLLAQSSSSSQTPPKSENTKKSQQLITPSAEHKMTQAERDAEAIARMEARFGGGEQNMDSHLDGTMGKETRRNLFRVI